MSEAVSKQPSVPQLLNKPVIQTSGTYVPPLPPSSNNAKETTLKEVPTAKNSKSQKRPLEGSQNGIKITVLIRRIKAIGLLESCIRKFLLIHITFLAGIPMAKHGRSIAPTPAAPKLESISLSEAQIANPEMLFKVNNTAK